MSESGSENGEVQELDLSNSDVVTKYKTAADICNKAIAAVVEGCQIGAKVIDLCKLGDEIINKEVSGIFKGKNIEKGVAFPTCISINSVVGYFSPLDDDTTTLAANDLVKIVLGSHIDGFIATQGTTVVVQEDFNAPIKGRAGDLIQAARTAYEAAIRLIRPGKKVADVAGPLNQIAEAFNCHLVEGVMSHNLKQFVIDGNKCVLNKPTPEHKVEDGEFEENEVYAVDIVVSTGEGKPRLKDERETTVYKRALDMEYHLRLKASRMVFSEINRRFPTMPFGLRALKDENEEKNKELQKNLRLGLVECLNHQLLHPYPVLHEKQGELVAQIKGTVLLMPNGTDQVTKCPQQPVESELKVEDEAIKQLLQSSLKSKKNKKKKKAGKADPMETSVEA